MNEFGTVQFRRNLFVYSALLVWLLGGCGGDDFKGYSPTEIDNSSGENEKNSGVASGHLEEDGTAVASQHLLWQWPCSMPSNNAQINENGEVELFGTGPHQVQITGGPLEVSVPVSLCQASNRARDIVFAVDVSFNAYFSDPSSNENVCARMRAIDGFLKAIDDPDQVRVGLVTYDSQTITNSPLVSVADFRASFVKESHLCNARLFGASNGKLAVGLGPVKGILLGNGRDQVAKEVILITASAPSGEKDGASQAADLRRAGVTISTYQIVNNSGTPAKHIASVGVDNQPLHRYFADANSFVNSLKYDDSSPIVAGTIAYKAVSRQDWASNTDMFADGIVEEYRFTISGVSKVSLSQGLNLRVQYADERGRPYSLNGTLNWK